MISVSDAINILQNALHVSTVAIHMQKLSGHSPTFDYRFLPFMSSLSNVLLSQYTEHSDDNQKHATQDICCNRLDHIIQGWGMKRQRVTGDGNCCFSAVAYYLINNRNTFIQFKADYFTSHNIHETLELSNLAEQLRRLVVQEWKDHQQDYEGFVVGVDVSQEIDLFLQSGHFNSDLGDTMVLALANALSLPIIVFSSMLHYPVINVNPRKIDVPIPVYVAYSHCGLGHYDGIVAATTHPTAVTPETKRSGCNCGKGVKTGKESCLPLKSKYTEIVRCPCFKATMACSLSCHCKNCNNPKGKRTESKRVSRKRSRHPWQLTVPRSAIFAMKAGESITPGPRSTREFFLLEQCLSYCLQEGIDITTQNLHILYNTVVDISKMLQDVHNVAVGAKQLEEIDKFLKEHEVLKTAFESFCIASITTQMNNIVS